MNIAAEQVWVSKTDDLKVLVLRVLDYIVSYQQDGFIKQMGDFEFKDHFTMESGDE